MTTSRPGHFSGAVSRAAHEAFGKPLVGFDGDDAAVVADQELRHFAVARADFDPGLIWGDGQRGQDAFAPSDVMEEMLA